MPIEVLDFDFVEEAAPTLNPRPYQIECLDAIRDGWKDYSRLLAVLSTGGGKTIIFSMVTQEVVNAGGKVLIVAHTEELLDQAIDKLYRTTGITADKEKADEYAGPYASVVVASIQSMSRTNRLLGFTDDHFDLVICDESHHVISKSYMKVMCYFHFGAESLQEDWKMPEPGIPYEHKARCLGVTATADRGDKRSLGEFYQHCCYEFGMLEMCREGWLVRPIVKNIPIKLDMRGVKKRAGDYDAGQVSERITPFIKEIARNIAIEAKDRKTVVFMPSVDTARQMAIALKEHGLDADFVSGACNDRNEKVAAFDRKGNGSAVVCAVLLLEGWDSCTVSCVVVLRLTKIRSLFVQAAGRAARTLPGIIDGLDTKEERLAAIAASPKPNMLLLDFLWLTDKLDFIQPVDLVATTPAMKKAMIETGMDDLIEAEKVAERDLMKAIEKAAKRHAKREARVIDPLALAVSLGDSALANWEPETKWDSDPMTDGQRKFLIGQHVDVTNIKYKGLASKVITRLVARMKMKLATPMQLNFMIKLGIPENECATLTMGEAGRLIDRVKAEKGWN